MLCGWCLHIAVLQLICGNALSRTVDTAIHRGLLHSQNYVHILQIHARNTVIGVKVS